jgi:LysR family transcriptional activator of nhaA
MEWLNYHHLRYFWLVAREGGLVQAAAVSGVAHQTVGSQIRLLEQSLGESLLVRRGRRLVLTPSGKTVLRYADEIFGAGRELQDALRGHPARGPRWFRVGVADAVPKLVTERLLRPARRLRPAVRIVCHEDRPENLFAQLVLHDLDVVLADAPVGGEVAVRAYNHLLGESPVGWFAGARLAHTLRSRWPQSLTGAPVVLPTANTTLRRSLDAWFDRVNVVPDIVAEIEDSALLQSFAAGAAAAFPASDAVAAAHAVSTAPHAAARTGHDTATGSAAPWRRRRQASSAMHTDIHAAVDPYSLRSTRRTSKAAAWKAAGMRPTAGTHRCTVRQ